MRIVKLSSTKVIEPHKEGQHMDTQSKDDEKSAQGVATQTNSLSAPKADIQTPMAGARAENNPINPQNAPNSREIEVRAAIQRLWMKLQIASAYDPTAADHGRSSARIALGAILEFLSVLFPDTPTLPIALQDLLQALVDLDRGTPNPLFARSKARGRAPITLADDLFRAIVAAAMTKRMEATDITLKVAARDIERRLGELGYHPARIKHNQIAKWREKMMEGGVGNLAVQRYKLALQLVKAMQPIEGTRFLLGNLPLLYPGQFSKKRTDLAAPPSIR
jgi:hypothetical protein